MKVNLTPVMMVMSIVFLGMGCVSTGVAEVSGSAATETAVSPLSLTPTLPSTPTVAAETAVPNSPTPTPTPTQTIVPTLTSSPTAPALPIGSPVVFFYNDGYLSRTDIEGSGIELITTSAVGETVWLRFWSYPPQISPNGHWLIVPISISRNRGAWQLFDLQERVIAVTGYGQSQLSPTWSPDSQRFAYLADDGICLYELASQTETCTFIGENLWGASWSPQGSYVAVTQADLTVECCRGQVWLFDVNTETAVSIGTYTAPPQASVSEAIEWTTDGVALMIKSADENVLSVLYSVTGDTPLTFTKQVRALAPDGQQLLFRTGEIGRLDGTIVYTLPTNETCSRALLGIHNWDWSPDGKRLAYLLSCIASPETSWLYMLDAETGDVLWQREIIMADIGATLPPEFLY